MGEETMTLEEAMKRIEELEEHIARQNELILKWTLRFAKEEAKQGNVGTKEKPE
jgi:hypothetical protein